MHNVKQTIHRDLKPANVIFTSEGNVKLCDFGLCRKLSDKQNFEVNTVAGTPRYYPPEMFFGECYSFKSDIWTLAILIFELLLEKEFKLLEVTNMTEIMENKINKSVYGAIKSEFFRNLLKKMLVPNSEYRIEINEMMDILNSYKNLTVE